MGFSSREYFDAYEEQHYFDEGTGDVYPYVYELEPKPSIISTIGKAISAFFSRLPLKDNTSYAAHLKEQQDIERSASWIEGQIKNCESPKYLESLTLMVNNLPVIYRNEKTQVSAWVDSLNMQLYLKNKQLNNH